MCADEDCDGAVDDEDDSLSDGLTWYFDDDGDEDLYICNDFAPDSMLRNDTPRGAEQPVFVEVSQDLLKGAPLGFGMGASWGDYDQDGDLDLYVTNMYSKAGNRIVGQIGKVDPRILASAHGNYLFKNENGVFTQKAGGKDFVLFTKTDDRGVFVLELPVGKYRIVAQSWLDKPRVTDLLDKNGSRLRIDGVVEFEFGNESQGEARVRVSVEVAPGQPSSRSHP